MAKSAMGRASDATPETNRRRSRRRPLSPLELMAHQTDIVEGRLPPERIALGPGAVRIMAGGALDIAIRSSPTSLSGSNGGQRRCVVSDRQAMLVLQRNGMAAGQVGARCDRGVRKESSPRSTPLPSAPPSHCCGEPPRRSSRHGRTGRVSLPR